MTPIIVQNGEILESDPNIVFAVRLAQALHKYGIPTHRLEAAMNAILRQLGVKGHFFSMPTGILASFGLPEQQRTSLIQVEPSEVDLEKQVLLDQLVSGVIHGKFGADEGIRKLDSVVSAPPRYGAVVTSIAFAVSSSAASRFFNGGWREAAVSAIIGLIIGIISNVVRRSEDASRIFEPAAAIIAAALSVLATTIFTPLSVYVTTLSGLIVLVPGLTLTTAVRELATRSLISGTARLMSAALIFFEIGFGVAVGSRLIGLVIQSSANSSSVVLPPWTLFLSLILAPIGFAVLLRARLRDVWIILFASVLSFSGARFGAFLFGPQLGVCLGAVIVGAASNAYARIFNRPSAIPLVPAILLLVPGSMGYGSLAKFLNRDIVSGIDTAFTMLIVSVALVTGLLVSNLVVPPRRTL